MDLKIEVKSFLDTQLSDFTNFRYEFEEDGEFLYVNFSEVLGEEVEKETSFKIIADVLYYHSTTFGWKAVTKASNNKFFWIDIVQK
jgi:hypothetical protein